MDVPGGLPRREALGVVAEAAPLQGVEVPEDPHHRRPAVPERGGGADVAGPVARLLRAERLEPVHQRGHPLQRAVGEAVLEQQVLVGRRRLHHLPRGGEVPLLPHVGRGALQPEVEPRRGIPGRGGHAGDVPGLVVQVAAQPLLGRHQLLGGEQPVALHHQVLDHALPQGGQLPVETLGRGVGARVGPADGQDPVRGPHHQIHGGTHTHAPVRVYAPSLT